MKDFMAFSAHRLNYAVIWNIVNTQLTLVQPSVWEIGELILLTTILAFYYSKSLLYLFLQIVLFKIIYFWC